MSSGQRRKFRMHFFKLPDKLLLSFSEVSACELPSKFVAEWKD